MFLMTRDNNDFYTNVTEFCGNGLRRGSITRACYNVDVTKYGMQDTRDQFHGQHYLGDENGYPYLLMYEGGERHKDKVERE